jgi:hypothetical protein
MNITSSKETRGAPELDMSALQGILVMPHAPTNKSTTTGNAPGNGSVVTLTIQDVTLVNSPPGPADSLPLGLSTLMMWSIDMDR